MALPLWASVARCLRLLAGQSLQSTGRFTNLPVAQSKGEVLGRGLRVYSRED